MLSVSFNELCTLVKFISSLQGTYINWSVGFNPSWPYKEFNLTDSYCSLYTNESPPIDYNSSYTSNGCLCYKDLVFYFLSPNKTIEIAHSITRDCQNILAPEFKNLTVEMIEQEFNERLKNGCYLTCKISNCTQLSQYGNPLFGHYFCSQHAANYSKRVNNLLNTSYRGIKPSSKLKNRHIKYRIHHDTNVIGCDSRTYLINRILVHERKLEEVKNLKKLYTSVNSFEKQKKTNLKFNDTAYVLTGWEFWEKYLLKNVYFWWPFDFVKSFNSRPKPDVATFYPLHCKECTKRAKRTIHLPEYYLHRCKHCVRKNRAKKGFITHPCDNLKHLQNDTLTEIQIAEIDEKIFQTGITRIYWSIVMRKFTTVFGYQYRLNGNQIPLILKLNTPLSYANVLNELQINKPPFIQTKSPLFKKSLNVLEQTYFYYSNFKQKTLSTTLMKHFTNQSILIFNYDNFFDIIKIEALKIPYIKEIVIVDKPSTFSDLWKLPLFWNTIKEIIEFKKCKQVVKPTYHYYHNYKQKTLPITLIQHFKNQNLPILNYGNFFDIIKIEALKIPYIKEVTIVNRPLMFDDIYQLSFLWDVIKEILGLKKCKQIIEQTRPYYLNSKRRVLPERLIKHFKNQQILIFNYDNFFDISKIKLLKTPYAKDIIIISKPYTLNDIYQLPLFWDVIKEILELKKGEQVVEQTYLYYLNPKQKALPTTLIKHFKNQHLLILNYNNLFGIGKIELFKIPYVKNVVIIGKPSVFNNIYQLLPFWDVIKETLELKKEKQVVEQTWRMEIINLSDLYKKYKCYPKNKRRHKQIFKITVLRTVDTSHTKNLVLLRNPLIFAKTGYNLTSSESTLPSLKFKDLKFLTNKLRSEMVTSTCAFKKESSDYVQRYSTFIQLSNLVMFNLVKEQAMGVSYRKNLVLLSKPSIFVKVSRNMVSFEIILRFLGPKGLTFSTKKWRFEMVNLVNALKKSFNSYTAKYSIYIQSFNSVKIRRARIPYSEYVLVTDKLSEFVKEHCELFFWETIWFYLKSSSNSKPNIKIISDSITSVIPNIGCFNIECLSKRNATLTSKYLTTITLNPFFEKLTKSYTYLLNKNYSTFQTPHLSHQIIKASYVHTFRKHFVRPRYVFNELLVISKKILLKPSITFALYLTLPLSDIGTSCFSDECLYKRNITLTHKYLTKTVNNSLFEKLTEDYTYLLNRNLVMFQTSHLPHKVIEASYTHTLNKYLVRLNSDFNKLLIDLKKVFFKPSIAPISYSTLPLSNIDTHYFSSECLCKSNTNLIYNTSTYDIWKKTYKNFIHKYTQYKSKRIFTFAKIKWTKFPCAYKVKKKRPFSLKTPVLPNNPKVDNINFPPADWKNLLYYCGPIRLELAKSNDVINKSLTSQNFVLYFFEPNIRTFSKNKWCIEIQYPSNFWEKRLRMYRLALFKFNKYRLDTAPIYTLRTNLKNFLDQGYAELSAYRNNLKVGWSSKNHFYTYRKQKKFLSKDTVNLTKLPFDNTTICIIKWACNSLLSTDLEKNYTDINLNVTNSLVIKYRLINLPQTLCKQIHWRDPHSRYTKLLKALNSHSFKKLSKSYTYLLNKNYSATYIPRSYHKVIERPFVYILNKQFVKTRWNFSTLSLIHKKIIYKPFTALIRYPTLPFSNIDTNWFDDKWWYKSDTNLVGKRWVKTVNSHFLEKITESYIRLVKKNCSTFQTTHIPYKVIETLYTHTFKKRFAIIHHDFNKLLIISSTSLSKFFTTLIRYLILPVSSIDTNCFNNKCLHKFNTNSVYKRSVKTTNHYFLEKLIESYARLVKKNCSTFQTPHLSYKVVEIFYEHTFKKLLIVSNAYFSKFFTTLIKYLTLPLSSIDTNYSKNKCLVKRTNHYFLGKLIESYARLVKTNCPTFQTPHLSCKVIETPYLHTFKKLSESYTYLWNKNYSAIRTPHQYRKALEKPYVRTFNKQFVKIHKNFNSLSIIYKKTIYKPFITSVRYPTLPFSNIDTNSFDYKYLYKLDTNLVCKCWVKIVNRHFLEKLVESYTRLVKKNCSTFQTLNLHYKVIDTLYIHTFKKYFAVIRYDFNRLLIVSKLLLRESPTTSVKHLMLPLSSTGINCSNDGCLRKSNTNLISKYSVKMVNSYFLEKLIKGFNHLIKKNCLTIQTPNLSYKVIEAPYVYTFKKHFAVIRYDFNKSLIALNPLLFKFSTTLIRYLTLPLLGIDTNCFDGKCGFKPKNDVICKYSTEMLNKNLFKELTKNYTCLLQKNCSMFQASYLSHKAIELPYRDIFRKPFVKPRYSFNKLLIISKKSFSKISTISVNDPTLPLSNANINYFSNEYPPKSNTTSIHKHLIKMVDNYFLEELTRSYAHSNSKQKLLPTTLIKHFTNRQILIFNRNNFFDIIKIESLKIPNVRNLVIVNKLSIVNDIYDLILSWDVIKEILGLENDKQAVKQAYFHHYNLKQKILPVLIIKYFENQQILIFNYNNFLDIVKIKSLIIPYIKNLVIVNKLSTFNDIYDLILSWDVIKEILGLEDGKQVIEQTWFYYQKLIRKALPKPLIKYFKNQQILIFNYGNLLEIDRVELLKIPYVKNLVIVNKLLTFNNIHNLTLSWSVIKEFLGLEDSKQVMKQTYFYYQKLIQKTLPGVLIKHFENQQILIFNHDNLLNTVKVESLKITYVKNLVIVNKPPVFNDIYNPILSWDAIKEILGLEYDKQVVEQTWHAEVTNLLNLYKKFTHGSKGYRHLLKKSYSRFQTPYLSNKVIEASYTYTFRKHFVKSRYGFSKLSVILKTPPFTLFTALIRYPILPLSNINTNYFSDERTFKLENTLTHKHPTEAVKNYLFWKRIEGHARLLSKGCSAFQTPRLSYKVIEASYAYTFRKHFIVTPYSVFTNTHHTQTKPLLNLFRFSVIINYFNSEHQHKLNTTVVCKHPIRIVNDYDKLRVYSPKTVPISAKQKWCVFNGNFFYSYLNCIFFTESVVHKCLNKSDWTKPSCWKRPLTSVRLRLTKLPHLQNLIILNKPFTLINTEYMLIPRNPTTNLLKSKNSKLTENVRFVLKSLSSTTAEEVNNRIIALTNRMGAYRSQIYCEITDDFIENLNTIITHLQCFNSSIPFKPYEVEFLGYSNIFFLNRQAWLFNLEKLLNCEFDYRQLSFTWKSPTHLTINAKSEKLIKYTDWDKKSISTYFITHTSPIVEWKKALKLNLKSRPRFKYTSKLCLENAYACNMFTLYTKNTVNFNLLTRIFKLNNEMISKDGNNFNREFSKEISEYLMLELIRPLNLWKFYLSGVKTSNSNIEILVDTKWKINWWDCCVVTPGLTFKSLPNFTWNIRLQRYYSNPITPSILSKELKIKQNALSRTRMSAYRQLTPFKKNSFLYKVRYVWKDLSINMAQSTTLFKIINSNLTFKKDKNYDNFYLLHHKWLTRCSTFILSLVLGNYIMVDGWSETFNENNENDEIWKLFPTPKYSEKEILDVIKKTLSLISTVTTNPYSFYKTSLSTWFVFNVWCFSSDVYTWKFEYLRTNANAMSRANVIDKGGFIIKKWFLKPKHP